ncbi:MULTISPECIES: hypothetical protein [Burkholderia]|uniref:hypothetical protein n=1 Tax=Burkholderia TaxID=32008 RepID=UPI001177540E|nr:MULTISPECIES: hypothetical protein [Burkholderia]MBY4725456.1 hypothetical protein [Burkholderia contaminans]MCI3968567.1 hypothetical protein [Burkholderia sp. HI4860]MDN7789455.1 hypothetical protein [Burkholderia contaminans]
MTKRDALPAAGRAAVMRAETGRMNRAAMRAPSSVVRQPWWRPAARRVRCTSTPQRLCVRGARAANDISEQGDAALSSTYAPSQHRQCPFTGLG